MVERNHSPFLEKERSRLRELIALLSGKYGYISVLGTDDRGLSYSATPGETRTSEPMWVQRGFAFRAQKDGSVAEYALPRLDPPELENPSPSALADLVSSRLDALLGDPSAMAYPPIPDEELKAEYRGNIGEDPFAADPEEVLIRLSSLRQKLTDGKLVVMAHSRYEFVDVSRIFISPRRELFQSFAWSQAYIFGIARKGEMSKMSYRAVSGRKGLEILSELEESFEDLRAELASLVDAIKIEPGEYEVIFDPDVAGTLAHEAFGHGVETDMFLKGRAKAAEYLGKRVGSDLVTMYDGAAGVDHSGSFLFDDEGRSGTDTKIIDRGILLGGISDSLSALSLGIPLTGNGRRQAYSHKAYARMTNTYFAPGSSRFEDMVASVKKGWLLSRLNAGMEDPRNWGIQLICMVGREIVDGAFKIGRAHV